MVIWLFQGFRVSELQSFRVSGFQGYRVSVVKGSQTIVIQDYWLFVTLSVVEGHFSLFIAIGIVFDSFRVLAGIKNCYNVDYGICVFIKNCCLWCNYAFSKTFYFGGFGEAIG